MKKISILGFGCGDKGEITLRTLETLRNADCVFVRTIRHPAAEILQEYNIAYESFDALYETADSFDDVYEQIAQRVLSRKEEHVSYIVPGSAVFAEKAVHLIVNRATCDVEVIPAVSFLDGIFAAMKQDALSSFKLLDALRLNEQKPDVSATNIICQIYDKATASDAKLALMDYYRDDTPVVIIQNAATADEKILPMQLYEIDRTNGINHLTSLLIPPASYRYTPSDFASLATIVAELRSEHGCPWDREQTHESLIPYLIEESYEAIDAIKEGDSENLCEELGDVLLQVLLHAQIASEENTFTITDVIQCVSEKMIRRHPHVFGQEDRNQDLTKLWESIKSSEKTYHNVTEKMQAVAKSLPSPIYAKKIQAVAAKVGFDFEDAEHAIEKIPEETAELLAAMRMDDAKKTAEECGDLMFSVINVLRLLHLDPEDCLKTSAQKFMHRFEKMEQLIIRDGKNLSELSEKNMNIYWNQAKNERNL